MKNASTAALLGLVVSLASTVSAAPANVGHIDPELIKKAVAAAKHPALLNIRHIEEIRSAEILLRSAQEDYASVDGSAPWVTVNDESQPVTTYTPKATVIDGSTSWENANPHSLTAEVYTWTTWGVISTSTGLPPNPTATGKWAEGYFSRCTNLDGEYAPFCRPFHNSTLFTGNTYYITWDPDYYSAKVPHSNLTQDISVRIDWLNGTSNKYQKLETFDSVPAKYGFWPLYVSNDYIKGRETTNVTISLYASWHGSNAKNKTEAVLPVLFSKPQFEQVKGPGLPTGKTLTIALPVALGSIVFIVIGVCLWNRKARGVSLSSIPRRRRGEGYDGVRSRRTFRKDTGIQLSTDPIHSPPVHPDDHDEFHGAAGAAYRDAPSRPHRDSDGLGSLAGSPTNENFHEQGTQGGRNAFRDEMARQDRERRDDPGFL